MRTDEQANLVGVLEECREELLRARAQARLDGHAGGDHLVAIGERVQDVANALRSDADDRRRRSLARRVRRVATPRLGTLRHHPPVPLRLPTRYFRTDPPDPAPRISIVTPTLQQGPFLERTLYSVTSQHYPNLEYIVRDGGSTDATREVLERYDGLLTDWTSAPDGGQAEALNSGFARSTGEIMSYLNSDDRLLPGSLACVARYFVAHPDVDVVYGNRVMIDRHDRQIGSWVLPGHDDGVLALNDYVPQETVFWRRSAWEAAGGRFDPSFDFALDWDLLLRMHAAGARMVHLRRFLGAFRVHSEQKTVVDAAVCIAESDRLRARVHGRGVSPDEANARCEAYLRRHVARHVLHRLAMRLPVSRADVRALPHAGEAAAGQGIVAAEAAGGPRTIDRARA